MHEEERERMVEDDVEGREDEKWRSKEDGEVERDEIEGCKEER